MSEAHDHAQALPAGSMLGQYRIDSVLGEGGFGITYKAWDTGLERAVVIKENLPVAYAFRETSSLTVRARGTKGDEEADFQWSLNNFSKEAAMLASLDHPGIVKVLNSFKALGTAYFVMPFVEGVAFDEVIRDRHEAGRPFSEEELRRILEAMLSCLGYLHDRGIYHRDIKPQNILIREDGEPILIDFGAARQRIGERSMTVLESPGYTPFEQLQSRGKIGPWSDLYGLGATLYKAITGESPPKANDRAFDDPLEPLAEQGDLTESYSSGFLAGVDVALRVRPEERWQDGGQWEESLRGGGEVTKSLPADFRVDPLQDLTEVAGTQSAERSGNDGSRQRQWRSVSDRVRRWGKPVAAVIAIALVVGGLVYGAMQWKQGNEERRAVERENRGREEMVQREMDEALARARELEDAGDIEGALSAYQAIADRLDWSSQVRSEAIQKENQLSELARIARAERDALEERVAREEQEERKREVERRLRGGEMVAVRGGRLGAASSLGALNVEDFEIGKTEVTWEQWVAVRDWAVGKEYDLENVGQGLGEQHPVTHVSWYDVVKWCNAASEAAGLTPVYTVNGRVYRNGRSVPDWNPNANGYRLPSEAEWEFAARGGTRSRGYTYSGSNNLDEVGWFWDNSNRSAQPVGQKKSNELGLHDMSGNVWEWCWDAAVGSSRRIRGGSWNDGASLCAVSRRSNYSPVNRYDSYGFRLARSSGN